MWGKGSEHFGCVESCDQGTVENASIPRPERPVPRELNKQHRTLSFIYFLKNAGMHLTYCQILNMSMK